MKIFCNLGQGPKAVLGPGTGLGEALLFWDSGLNDYRVRGSVLKNVFLEPATKLLPSGSKCLY